MEEDSVISMCVYRKSGDQLRAVVAGLALLLLTAAPAAAQAPDPNPGALTFSGAFDVPTLYYFRGIRQETDPGLTMWPYADLKIDFMSGDGAVKSAAVNFGVWNSLHTGSSGTGTTGRKLQYEEDFYVALTLGFADAINWTTQYTAYTSPNGAFSTVKEVLFKVSQGSWLAPYGLVAFEFDTSPGLGQADGGSEGGSYVELGIGPTWSVGDNGSTLAVPVKLGLSLSDYYELGGVDNKFGYFDLGGLYTIPFSTAPTRFGTWNFHVGADLLMFGDTTEAFNVNNDGETSKGAVTAFVGIGVSY
jgi:hypothetical protein